MATNAAHVPVAVGKLNIQANFQKGTATPSKDDHHSVQMEVSTVVN